MDVGLFDFPAATIVTTPPTSLGTQTLSYPGTGIINAHTTSVGTGATVTTQCFIGIDEMENDGNIFSVYPNPVVDKLYVDGSENKIDISKVILHNNMGTVVAEGTWIKEGVNKKGIVDMNNLPTGVYILRLFTSDRIVSFKVYKR